MLNERIYRTIMIQKKCQGYISCPLLLAISNLIVPLLNFFIFYLCPSLASSIGFQSSPGAVNILHCRSGADSSFVITVGNNQFCYKNFLLVLIMEILMHLSENPFFCGFCAYLSPTNRPFPPILPT